MDRGSDKHGPHVDDEMKREVESIQHGAPVPSRVEEFREIEPVEWSEAPEGASFRPGDAGYVASGRPDDSKKEAPMAQQVREVMTKDPVSLPPTTTLRDAAGAMRDQDIGDVIVLEGDRIGGIVTDRDIVVRAVAEGRDPSQATLQDIVSGDVVTVTPDDSVATAIQKMRDRAIRRLPVVEGGRPVGVVSIGDLAVERDPDSALADISAAEPNE
jgi:CBS domain-containing protein